MSDENNKPPTEESLLNQSNDRSIMEKMMAELEQKTDGQEELITNEQNNQSQAQEEREPQADSPRATEGEERQAEEQTIEEAEKDEEKPVEEDEDKVDRGDGRNKKGQWVNKEKQEAAEKKAKEEEGDIDEEIKEIRALQLRKGASEKSQDALRVLKEKAENYYKEVKQLRTKSTEIETRAKELETRAMTPEREKELEELRNFRRYIAIEDDPEFNKEHTEAIQRSESHLMGLLKSWQLPEGIQKFIADSGGPYEFSVSSNLMPNMKNDDGSPMTQAQWWNKNIEKRMAAFPKEKRALDAAMNDLVNRNMAKERAIADARANRNKIVQERAEKAKTAQQEYAQRVEAHVPKVLQETGLTDLKEKEIPANATAEQKAEIQEYNEAFKEGQELVKRYATSNAPEDRVESAIWATYGKLMATKEKGKMTKQIDTLKAENAKLVAQIADFKKSGKTIPKSSAPADKNKQASNPSRNESASERMERAMAGRNL